MTNRRQELDERIESYLDGDLAADDARWFERELTEPEAANALRQSLFLREVLRTSLPDEPPPGLAARLERELGVAAVSERPEAPVNRFRTTWAALEGASWAWRGPMAGFQGGSSVTNAAADGLGPLGQAVKAGAARAVKAGAARAVKAGTARVTGRQPAREPSRWSGWLRALGLGGSD